jgi:hypothetical protein
MSRELIFPHAYRNPQLNYRPLNLSYFSPVRKLLLIFCFFALISEIHSQSLKQWEALGDEAMENNDPASACVAFYEAFSLDSTIFDLTVKYAETLFLTKDYKLAEYYYGKAYEKDRGRLYAEGQFHLAAMQKYNGNYPQALRNYKKYSTKVKSDKTGYAYQKCIKEIESCTWAINARRNATGIEIHNLGDGVNTTESEFAPFPFSDSLLFYTSYDHPNSSNGFKIFRASIEDSLFYKDKGFLSALNEDGSSNGNLSFSSDKSRAYFTRCNESGCKIYECDIVNGTLSPPLPLPTLSCDECHNTMPTTGVYKGVEYLYYASDRPGTRGQLDIWWSERNPDGSYGPPVNAGDNVNSPGNELSPFYLYDRLYFSSDWHIGFGGLDICYSKGYPRSFDIPENMGYPLNSSLNDLYFVYDGEAKQGFFASNRPGSQSGPENTCCNDIYRIAYSDSMETVEPDPVYSSLEELNSYLPVTLYFHNDEPNPNSRDTTTQLSYLEAYDSYKKLIPKYLRENTKVLSGDDKDNAQYDVEDFFAFQVDKGRSDLTQFSRLLLNELREGREIQLTIKGFASPRAKSDYNVNLTKRRISSLVNYLAEYESGVFLPFIQNSDSSGGRLTFMEVPFGEYMADQEVSDELGDEKLSIYSRAASLERKIEIQSVERASPDSLFAEFKPLQRVHDFGNIQADYPVEYTFAFTNTGTDTLRIDSIAATCECTVPELSQNVLAPGEKAEILVIFNPGNKSGNVVRVVQVFTNAGTEPEKLTITANVQ